MSANNKIYSFICALFCVCIVVVNLVFKKFVLFNLLILPPIELSVGVLFYPITFLLTDITTEIYGKQYANFMIHASIIICIIIAALIVGLDLLPATNWSTVNDAEFHNVFGSFSMAFAASVIAVYIAQLLDVRIFLFLKQLTNSKHLWLRNNVSTIIAQIIDTLCVLLLLCAANIIPWEQFTNLYYSGILFKLLFALLDTPLCYLGVWVVRRYQAVK